MTTSNQEEQMYRLAVSLLINTLSQSLLRTLAPPVQKETEPEDPAVLRTIHDVANAKQGTVIRDVDGKVLQKAERHLWYIPGNYVGRVSQEIALPARVLS